MIRRSLVVSCLGLLGMTGCAGRVYTTYETDVPGPIVEHRTVYVNGTYHRPPVVVVRGGYSHHRYYRRAEPRVYARGDWHHGGHGGYNHGGGGTTGGGGTSGGGTTGG